MSRLSTTLSVCVDVCIRVLLGPKTTTQASISDIQDEEDTVEEKYVCVCWNMEITVVFCSVSALWISILSWRLLVLLLTQSCCYVINSHSMVPTLSNLWCCEITRSSQHSQLPCLLYWILLSSFQTHSKHKCFAQRHQYCASLLLPVSFFQYLCCAKTPESSGLSLQAKCYCFSEKEKKNPIRYI